MDFTMTLLLVLFLVPIILIMWIVAGWVAFQIYRAVRDMLQ